MGLQSYINKAVLLAVEASTMHQREKKEFRFKIVAFILVFISIKFSRFIFGYIKKHLIPKKLKLKLAKINFFRNPVINEL